MVSLQTLVAILAIAVALGEFATKIAKVTATTKDDAYVARYVKVVNAITSFVARIIPTFSDLKK